jgi:hypothetical protein
MHIVFSLLRNKDLYMFRVLLDHSQEALHNKHLVRLQFHRNRATDNWHYTHAIYQNTFCAAPPEGERVMPEYEEAFDSK